MTHALEAWSLIQWATREVLSFAFWVLIFPPRKTKLLESYCVLSYDSLPRLRKWLAQIFFGQMRVFLVSAIPNCEWLNLGCLFLNFFFYLGVWLINGVVSVSGVPQSESVIRVIYVLIQVLCPFRLLQSIEQISLCYTSGSLLVISFKYNSV